MESSKAVLVCGPESSGNRFLVRQFVESGWAGVSGALQPYDTPDFGIELPPEPPGKLVLHRSVPHYLFWDAAGRTLAQLKERGYLVFVIVPVRGPAVVAHSAHRAGHAATLPEACSKVCAAWPVIASAVAGHDRVQFLPYYVLGCESVRKWLEAWTGEPFCPITPWFDADAKYRPDLLDLPRTVGIS